ncbi:hypothetical protein ACFQRL_01530 [Microbacterium fluvii]|uniref:Uncharacterized protein n=1 Tax=Microbacterium fluvii TaxID=415215 RepID=A0ABW2HCY7_9MICO|nr:hypothetical protein [Microbacterium fluvii]MCU4671269.1 hypothetical protein [Microbacterium fluvii]
MQIVDAAVLAQLIGKAATSKLAASGQRRSEALVGQLKTAGPNDVDFVIDGMPVQVKFYSKSGREVTPPERAAAAQARVSADEKRGLETPAWIKELSSGEG